MNELVDLPRVLVVSLGGTIAATANGITGGGVTPQLDALDLISAVPGLDDVAAISAVSFRQVPSGDLTIEDVVSLARQIELAFADGIDGVVVTQGTDTIEETAFVLDLLIGSARPVVVTGAMRNPTLVGSDGPANLLAAVRVAASTVSRGLGTLVVLNDEVHAARFVRKMNSSSPATFRSPSCGPIGWIVEDRVRIIVRVARLALLTPPVDDMVAAVALVKMSLGDDGRQLDPIGELGFAGAVVECFGGGHVPARVVSSLETLSGLMPVVLASRTGSGELLQATYGFPGSERDLLSRGLLSAGSLDGLKARILLSLITSVETDRLRIREVFASTVTSILPTEPPLATA